MDTKILILGATGGIGYAVTDNLLSKNIPVAILVRNKQKALRLFGDSPLLTVYEGDVQDATLLNRIAHDKDFIFHGVNYPYTDWFGNIDTATIKVIDAASLNHATIVYPGSVYNFGNMRSIKEDSVPAPVSRKGALRVQLEEMMEQAVQQGRCRALVVRLPDFWGPNVVNHGTVPVFAHALKKKALHYIGNADVPHQFVFTKDAAEIIVMLMMANDKLRPYDVFNYGGQTFTTAREFLHTIAQVADAPANVQVMKRWVVTVMAWFMPVMREVKEMLYLFENPVCLNDEKVKRTFPEFKPTPLTTAVAETLEWFRANRIESV